MRWRLSVCLVARMLEMVIMLGFGVWLHLYYNQKVFINLDPCIFLQDLKHETDTYCGCMDCRVSSYCSLCWPRTHSSDRYPLIVLIARSSSNSWKIKHKGMFYLSACVVYNWKSHCSGSAYLCSLFVPNKFLQVAILHIDVLRGW